MTKFSGTLRSVSQNFGLAAIYDVEIANNSANLQKIPMFDLNADEKTHCFCEVLREAPIIPSIVHVRHEVQRQICSSKMP